MRISSVLSLSLYLFSILFITPSLCSTHITLKLALSKTRKHHHHSTTKHINTPSNGVRLFATTPPEVYTISLSLGSPPQSIPVLFDTGSNNIWVPCGTNYSCSDCFVKTSKIVTYKPHLSTSVQSATCDDKKCQWLDTPQFAGSCLDCNNVASLSNCSSPCTFIGDYGTGGTTGQAVTDKLHLPSQVAIDDLFFGCSSKSIELAQGVVGFGRLPASLPSQLKLSKFSYCLVSHNFDDDKNVSSKLVLGDSCEVTIPDVRYTPFVKNPPMLPFNTYYYVQVTEITVGGKHVNLPYGLLLPNAKSGNGGTIVDSGTAATVMAPAVYGPIMKEFNAQLTPDQLNRVVPAGPLSCFYVSGERKAVLPEVVFHFKGGATMDLPVENYMNLVEDVVCLPFVNQTTAVGLDGAGPGIILGNYHQQNYYLEFDLKNERLGIKKHNCAA